jgi:hypothetical protein
VQRDPTPSLTARVANGPNCGNHTVTITWTSNLSSVHVTGPSYDSTESGSGTKDFPFNACPTGTVSYHFSGSNGSGSASADAIGCVNTSC